MYPPLHQSFVDCFVSLGLHQWVDVPTYVSSGNTLDLAFTLERDRVGEIEVKSPLPNCGHCTVLLSYYFQSGITTGNAAPPKHFWHHGKYKKIDEHLCKIDWQFELQNLTIDSMYERFLSIVRPLIALYVPLSPNTTPPTCCRSPPKALKNSRRQAWGAYKNARSIHDRQSPQATQALAYYDSINNRFRNFFTSKQINYEKSLIQKLKSSSKPFHQYKKSKKVGTPSVRPLRMDCGELTMTVPRWLTLLPPTSAQFTLVKLAMPPLHTKPLMASLTVSLLLYRPLKISSRHSTQTPAWDQMAFTPTSWNPALLLLFPCFWYSETPSSWVNCQRNGRNPPLYPYSRKVLAIHLWIRSISLTSVCCKTLERFISESLYSFLDSNGIFSNDQYGFRQGRTVDDQLLLVYNDVTAWLDTEYIVDVVLFDFSKAFDVVNHSLLIDKLRLLGVHGPLLSWITETYQ